MHIHMQTQTGSMTLSHELFSMNYLATFAYTSYKECQLAMEYVWAWVCMWWGGLCFHYGIGPESGCICIMAQQRSRSLYGSVIHRSRITRPINRDFLQTQSSSIDLCLPFHLQCIPFFLSLSLSLFQSFSNSSLKEKVQTALTFLLWKYNSTSSVVVHTKNG